MTHHRPSIYRAIHLGPGSGKIVIEHWGSSDEPRLQNLLHRAADGSPVWRAALPQNDGRECFVQMRRDGDTLFATTFQGVTVELDIASGCCQSTANPSLHDAGRAIA